jgi:hypothetical protein
MGEHSLELTRREKGENALRDRHGGVLRIATGRKRIRRVRGNDVDARHRHARTPSEVLDDAVDVRRLLPRQGARCTIKAILSENQYEPMLNRSPNAPNRSIPV